MGQGINNHAEFLNLLNKKRRLWVQQSDENGFNLDDIFPDFYPDKAHFVYELLQNAEDVGATEITFNLTADRLVVEHDGRRKFTESDVEAITALNRSTKAKDTDKIGKFGVGFKSVFVYANSPTIRSGNFAFRIVRLVVPEPISFDDSIGDRTRFEFLFDNPKMPPQDAYAEIAAGLNELDEKTLLFLSNLQSVTWRIGTQSAGAVMRIQHSNFHFEILKEIRGKAPSSSHFLKFDQAVPSLENQRVAIAFPLDILPGVHSFDPAVRLANQLKIVAAEPGSVAVFFPAVKETSGLRFHLHAPFVPELSRASIKETKANIPLFEQLASLAASSLHRIKELGFLTPDFLSVLPNPQDRVPPRYEGIHTAIIAAMKAQPLTPTHGKGHAPASRLIQAKASLKELLSESDIAFLVDHKDDPPLWAIGVTLRNNRIDQFLSGLEIREWGLAKFIETLRKHARDEDGLYPIKPDEKFLAWLKQKPAAWMQELYALLHGEAQNLSHQLKTLCIVRLSDGNLSRADQAFFATGTTAADVPVVDTAVYTHGTGKSEKDNAKQFLLQIGVREIGEAEQIELILKRRYTKEAPIPDDKTYLKDLTRFVAFVEDEPHEASLFEDFYVFQGDDNNWYTSKGVYLDRPYLDTDLSAYYGALQPDAGLKALHARYIQCGIEIKKLSEFAKAVGVRTTLAINEGNCSNNPERNHLFSALGNWNYKGINRDYFITHLDTILKSPSIELSRLIWKTLRALPSHPNYLEATFRRNASNDSRSAASRLVHDLRAASWVPQGDSVFVRPIDALRERLPKGFAFDAGDSWLKAVQFGETAIRQSAQAQQKDAAAKSLGFTDAAEAERARRFSDLPQAEQENFLAEYESRNKPALPDGPLANPERRAQNVREQALNAPDKRSENRERSVSIGREDVKAQAYTYLRERYRNADGDVTCQICKGPLPFKIDGQEYFEVVEFLPELTKRHHQNYLALCPNHSVMFHHGNASMATMREHFQALTGNELAVLLADQDLTVYFSKKHIIDLKAVLDAEDEIAHDAAAEELAEESATG